MQPNSKFLLNMETKDELLSKGEKYFEKVMQDFNQNRKGRNLRKKQRNGCSHVITKYLKCRSRNVHNA